jgi:hypothetical protein
MKFATGNPGAAEGSAVQRPFVAMFFDSGDEKRLLSSNRSPWKGRLPLCHPERSRGICGSADLSWKCFSTEVMKNAFCPATALHGGVAFPFVIPSAAEGSAVQTFRGNVFRQSAAQRRDQQVLSIDLEFLHEGLKVHLVPTFHDLVVLDDKKG